MAFTLTDSTSRQLAVSEINKSFQEMKAKVLEHVGDMSNLEAKAKVRQRLEDLDRLTQDLQHLTRQDKQGRV